MIHVLRFSLGFILNPVVQLFRQVDDAHRVFVFLRLG